MGYWLFQVLLQNLIPTVFYWWLVVNCISCPGCNSQYGTGGKGSTNKRVSCGIQGASGAEVNSRTDAVNLGFASSSRLLEEASEVMEPSTVIGDRQELVDLFAFGENLWLELQQLQMSLNKEETPDAEGLAADLVNEWSARLPNLPSPRSNGSRSPVFLKDINPVSRFALVRLILMTQQAILGLKGSPSSEDPFSKTDTIITQKNVDIEAVNLFNIHETYRVSPRSLMAGQLAPDSDGNEAPSASSSWKLAPSDGEAMARWLIMDEKDDKKGVEWLEATVETLCANNGTESITRQNKQQVVKKVADLFYVLVEDHLPGSHLQEWENNHEAQFLKNPCVTIGNDNGRNNPAKEYFFKTTEAIREKVTAKPRNWFEELQVVYRALCGVDSDEGNKVPTHEQNDGAYSVEENSLGCHLDRKSHPYLVLDPNKVEVLSKDPPVLIYHDCLRSVSKLIDGAKSTGLDQSKLEKNDAPSKFRTSETTMLNKVQAPDLFQWINSRSSVITGLDPNGVESFQVNSYAPGEHFQLHHDSFYSGMPQNVSDSGPKGRIATLMYYLNDVESGGRTVLPKLGLTVKPERGSALFWYNNHRNNGSADLRSFHGGCPVLRGHKWVGVKWFNIKSQLSTLPCTMDEFE